VEIESTTSVEVYIDKNPETFGLLNLQIIELPPPIHGL